MQVWRSNKDPDRATIMPMRFASLALSALMLGALVSGCGNDTPQMGKKSAPKVYKTVVSLSPSSTEIAAMIFLREIAGRSESCDQPATVKDKPVVMKGLKPDYEQIAKIKPDGVMYDPDLFQPSDIEKFKELGIDTYPLSKGDSVAEFCDMIYDFGKFTQAETLGSEYVDRIMRERQTAMAAAPKPAVTMAVLMGGSGGEHMIAGTEGFIADVVRSGGAEPVGPAGKQFVTLNAESFIKMDPEVIIVSGTPDAVLDDPRFAQMRAIKSARVFGTNPNVVLRRGAYVERFIKRVSDLAQSVKR